MTTNYKRTAEEMRGDYGEIVFEQLKSSPLWTLLASNRELDDLGAELGVKVYEFVEKLIEEKVEAVADEAMRATAYLDETNLSLVEVR